MSTSTNSESIFEQIGDNHVATIRYVDSSSENNRNRRDFSTVLNDQVNEFDNVKSTLLDSITVIWHPISDNELSNKKYVDKLNESFILRFNQTRRNYLEVNVGNTE